MQITSGEVCEGAVCVCVCVCMCVCVCVSVCVSVSAVTILPVYNCICKVVDSKVCLSEDSWCGLGLCG